MKQFKGTKEFKITSEGTCRIQLNDGHIDVWYDLLDDVNEEKARANAQLIIAAPELLEALQNALSALISLTGKDKPWIEIKEAEKAINKALGND